MKAACFKSKLLKTLREKSYTFSTEPNLLPEPEFGLRLPLKTTAPRWVPTESVTSEYGLVGVVVLGLLLDVMILEVFSNL